jgi:sporulation protein YlmC with PRC-barrel domain
LATSTTGTGASTPSANVPVTGAEHQIILLSDILKMNVNDNSGTQIGLVTGIVINRTMSTASGTGNTVPGAGGTAGSSAGAATPTVGIGKGALTTPTASAGAGATTGSAMVDEGNNPRIVYAIVQTNNAGGSTNSGEVLVPWEAFDFSGEMTSTSVSSMTALTLNSDIDASLLASAPAFDEMAVTTSGWDSDVTAYWSGQGLNIPVTGAEASMTEPVVVRGNFGSVNVVDASGKNVAQVRDLVIDATTGEVVYAIIGGGSLNNGSSLFVVPVGHLAWNSGKGQGLGANTLGDFGLNFDASQFGNAPTINSISDLDFSSADWNSTYDTYWSGVSKNP